MSLRNSQWRWGTDMQDFSKLSGIDQLRHAVHVLDSCRESFNQRYTVAELVRLVNCMMASGWDFSPDQWEQEQLTDALRYGIAPAFCARSEAPITYACSGEDMQLLRIENACERRSVPGRCTRCNCQGVIDDGDELCGEPVCCQCAATIINEVK